MRMLSRDYNKLEDVHVISFKRIFGKHIKKLTDKYGAIFCGLLHANVCNELYQIITRK